MWLGRDWFYICILVNLHEHMSGVDMGDGGSVDSGRPETPDTDESSEVSFICLSLVERRITVIH